MFFALMLLISINVFADVGSRYTSTYSVVNADDYNIWTDTFKFSTTISVKYGPAEAAKVCFPALNTCVVTFNCE